MGCAHASFLVTSSILVSTVPSRNLIASATTFSTPSARPAPAAAARVSRLPAAVPASAASPAVAQRARPWPCHRTLRRGGCLRHAHAIACLRTGGGAPRADRGHQRRWHAFRLYPHGPRPRRIPTHAAHVKGAAVLLAPHFFPDARRWALARHRLHRRRADVRHHGWWAHVERDRPHGGGGAKPARCALPGRQG